MIYYLGELKRMFYTYENILRKDAFVNLILFHF